MEYQLEYPYELPIYQVIFIQRDGSVVKSIPSRMPLDFAEEIARNTVEDEENYIDFQLILMSEEEENEFISSEINRSKSSE